MAPPQKHRQPIIDAAVRSFRRNGYSATGINDIIDLSGAPKGSLYHYFPEGKTSIAVAAIADAGDRIVASLEMLARTSATVGDLILAYAELLGKWLAASDYRDGCPMTTVLLELAPQTWHVTEAGRKAFGIRNDFLMRRLVGDGYSEDRARSLALLCTTSLQGALVEARIARSKLPIRMVAQELSHILKASLPDKNGGRSAPPR
ncbi:MAG: TetR/AcrR family transcriptional regulator [Rhodothalassiaceae bacterium]